MSRSLIARLNRKYGEPVHFKKRKEYLEELEAEVQELTKDVFNLEEIRLDYGKKKKSKKKVIIVGGGFAGLSAAHALTQKGFSVTVLEARDRLGGRVHSLHKFSKGQITEGGAELIGSNHPLWVRYAKEFCFGLNSVTSDESFSGAKLNEPFMLDGREIPDKEAEILQKNLEYVCGEMVKLTKGLDAKSPWLFKDAKRLDNTPLSDWLDQQVASMKISEAEKKLLRIGLESDLANNNAVPTKNQSLLAMLALVKAGKGNAYWKMTEVFRCSMGNDALAQAMAKAVKEKGNKVKCNTPVKRIVLDEQDGVVVTDKHGKNYKADYVILAIPPSTWKYIKMDGEIEKKYKSQMGTAVKYLSAVKSRFWINSGLAPSGASDTLGMTWEGSDNQIVKRGKEIELTVFAGANIAKKMLRLKKKKRKAFFSLELEKMFNGYKTDVIDTNFKAWPEEQWTKAGYSFPNVGEVCTKIKLQNQVYKKRLLFAGEHTCMGYVGYMEGALRSGVTAAKRISELM
jgi:monoamine oxidase